MVDFQRGHFGQSNIIRILKLITLQLLNHSKEKEEEKERKKKYKIEIK